MTLRLVTAPTDLPITLDDAKAWLRVDHDEEDALIEAIIRGALAHIEMWTSKVYVEQVWEQVLDAFPVSEIGLGMGPVVSVTSVKYVDAEGAEVTIDPTGYVVDNVSSEGWVMLATGSTWPTPMETINAVVVRFVIGAEPLPEDARLALRLIIASWYNTREDATPTELKSVPTGAYSLLNLHRRQFV